MKSLLALGALALVLTGCSATAAKPAPTLEDAGKACVRYVIVEKGQTREIANSACEIRMKKIGEKAFIKEWTSD